MNLQRSKLECVWDDLLSGEQIEEWVANGKQCRLPDIPGVYRFLFPSEGSEKPRAYVGETEHLSSRLSDYFRAAIGPVTTAFEDEFNEEKLREAIRCIHRCSTVRVGEYLALKCGTRSVQMQRLRLGSEAVICGVEVGEQLFTDKIGRVFLEHWAILSTERNGYYMLNRNPSLQGKTLWKTLHRSSEESVVKS